MSSKSNQTSDQENLYLTCKNSLTTGSDSFEVYKNGEEYFGQLVDIVLKKKTKFDCFFENEEEKEVVCRERVKNKADVYKMFFVHRIDGQLIGVIGYVNVKRPVPGSNYLNQKYELSTESDPDLPSPGTGYFKCPEEE